MPQSRYRTSEGVFTFLIICRTSKDRDNAAGSASRKGVEIIMSTLSLTGSRLPDPVSKGHSDLGHALAKSASRAASRLWASFVAMQDRRAQDYALPCLAQMSPDQLKEIGYSPVAIEQIKAYRHLSPPYWV